MANPEHLAALLKSTNDWNKWRQNNPDVRPDLREAHLSEKQPWRNERPDISAAYLCGADLSGVDLSGADLSQTALNGANLRDADLNGADLSRANLSAADLREARLFRADLRGADFSRAHLNWADLSSANLSAANLSAANLSAANLSAAILHSANLRFADLSGAVLSDVHLDETIFSDTNLRDVEGLDNCNHGGPSIIDHGTLARSGPLPLAFLRGCGLSDKFIEYLPSLFWNEPIQFYSCFISYSTKDQEFAERLFNDLQGAGVRCWFAAHDIQGGKKIHEQIDKAIQVHDRLLLILSEDSIRSSWVETEIARARKREKRENRRMLFPVRLVDFETLRDWECFDADTGKDSAREIREFFIPDFSVWKDFDSYQRTFQSLLRDLKAEIGAP